MKPDKESFLTAYLDDALDPEARLRVESSLVSDPALAARLRALGAVRDAVARLPRPSLQVDLSGAVLARIAQRRWSLFTRDRLLSTASGRAAILLATAASLLVVASATVILRNLDTQRLGLGRGANLARSRPEAHRPRVSVASSNDRPSPAPAPPSVSTEVATTGHDPRSLSPAHDEILLDQELQKVRRLLDSPNLRKVYLVTDVVGGHAARQVGDMLGRMPRKHASYLRLTVGPEVALDAEHPGESSVFAVVVDEQEQRRVRDELSRSFPFDLEEIDPNPETVTMLADIGQVAVFDGKPVADVFQPERPGTAALKSVPSKTITLKEPLPAGDRTAGEDRAFEPDAPHDPPGPDAGDRHASVDRAPPSVILVWVTRPVR
jgi:hypothetical protein